MAGPLGGDPLPTMSDSAQRQEDETVRRLQRRLDDIEIANREVQGWISMHGSEVPSELIRELAHLDWVIRQAP